MKKQYLNPVMEELVIENRVTLLSGSGVGSDSGIGFGGVDTGGSLDPEAPLLELKSEDFLDLSF